jgi:AcrR family transcriptional regulator
MVDRNAREAGSEVVESCGTTRDRLLDAAEELFASKGYAGTSVREITAVAGSNLAAVNYHFGGKHQLYRETLLRRLASMRRQRLSALDRARQHNAGHQGAGRGDLAPTLRTFAEAFLAPVRQAPAERLPLRLLMREVIDPRLPRHLFETELVLPVRRALTSAIREAAPSLAERTVQLCAQSFIAQLVHALHAHRFDPGGDEAPAGPAALAELVDHVVRFTTAAIDHLQENQP